MNQMISILGFGLDTPFQYQGPERSYEELLEFAGVEVGNQSVLVNGRIVTDLTQKAQPGDVITGVANTKAAQ